MAFQWQEVVGLQDKPHPCPGKIECDSNRTSYDIGVWPSYVAIASSVFSCLGSILIVLTFIIYKDIRSGMAQRIITALAIADFVSAAGYIVGSVNFLVAFNHTSCPHFKPICRGQAFITSWSSLSSFAWTATLAIYFYIVLVFKKRKPFHTKCQQISLHIFAWVSPLLVVIPFTALGYLGYAPYAASNWCFVADPYANASVNQNNLLFSSLKVLAAGKFWEILTYFIVIFLYWHIICILDKIRRNNNEVNARAERGRVERKMIYIPLLFLLLRVWGTTDFFLNIGMQATVPSEDGCIEKPFHYADLALGYLQAIGDPGQGWGNALLYVFLSGTIRRRLFSEPFRKCCAKIGYTLVDLTHDTTEPRPVDHSSEEIEETTPPEGADGRAHPNISRRQAIQRHDTVTTISDFSQAGPREEARPGPSPVPEPEFRQRPTPVLGTLVSETTTTTTTAVGPVDMARPGPFELEASGQQRQS